MSRKKRTAIICAVVIGVLVALSLLLPLLLDLEKYRSFVARAVGDRIGREVSVDHLKLSLWGGLGAELQNLSISSREGFGKGHFLSSKRVKVEVKALPLLRKKVKVKQVVVEQPDILVQRNRQGVYNFSDLLSAREPMEAKDGSETAPGSVTGRKPPSPPVRLVGAVLVSKLSIKDGRLTFLDRYTRPGEELVTRVSDIELKVDNLSSESPFSFDLRARVGEADKQNLRLKGTVTPEPEAQTASRAAFDLKIDVTGLGLSELAPYYGRGVPFQMDEALVTAEVHLSGDTEKEIKARGEISLNWTGTTERETPPDGMNISIGEEITYDLRKASVTISPTRMTVGKSELEIYGTIANLKTEPEFNLRLASTGFDLNMLGLLYPPLKEKLPRELELEGKADFSLNLKGSAGKMRAKGTADLKGASVAYGGYFQKSSQQPMKVDFQLTSAGEALHIDTLNADLGDLWFDLAGRIRMEPEPELDLKFFTSPAPLETLNRFFPELKGIRLKGRLRLEGTVQGPANRPQELQFRIKSYLVEVGLLEEIIEGVPGMREGLPEKLELAGTLSAEISVSGKRDHIQAAGRASLNDTSIRYGDNFHKPAGFPMEADFDLTLGKEQLTIKKLKLRLGKTRANITGGITRFTRPRLNLKLAGESPALDDLAKVIPAAPKYSPGGRAAVDLRLRGETDKPDEFSAEGYLRLKGVRLDVPQTGKTLSGLSGEALFSGRAVRIPSMAFTYGRTTMLVGVKLEDYAKPDIRFTMRSPFFAVEDFLLPEKAPRADGPTGKTEGGGRGPPEPIKGLMALNAEGTIRIERLVHKKLELTDLKADIKMSGGILTVDPMAFNLYGGRCRGFTRVDFSGQEPRLRVVADLNGLDVSRILQSQTSIGHVMRGTLYTTLDVRGAGTRYEVLSRTLRGRGRVSVERGSFTGFSLLRGLSFLTGISGLGLSGREQTPFDRLEAEFRLADGKIKTDPVRLSFGEYGLTASGYVGLDRSLAYEVQVTVGEALSRHMGGSSVGGFFMNRQGRIEVPLTVRGTIARPRVSLNEAFLQRRLMEYGVSRLLKGSRTDMPDLLKGILEGLEGSIRQQPDDRQRGEEQAPLDPGSLLRELLKRR